MDLYRLVATWVHPITREPGRQSFVRASGDPAAVRTFAQQTANRYHSAGYHDIGVEVYEYHPPVIEWADDHRIYATERADGSHALLDQITPTNQENH